MQVIQHTIAGFARGAAKAAWWSLFGSARGLSSAAARASTPPRAPRDRAVQGGAMNAPRHTASLGGALLLLALGFAVPAALAQTAQSPQDFDTLTAAGNDDPRGLWSDGTTMWVVDATDGKIYAYNLTTKARDADKDFDTLTAAGNTAPIGLWSDKTTMWAADVNEDKIYAYNMATKARDAAKDFDTLDAAFNDDPIGLWSDNTTMWVADSLRWQNLRLQHGHQGPRCGQGLRYPDGGGQHRSIRAVVRQHHHVGCR